MTIAPTEGPVVRLHEWMLNSRSSVMRAVRRNYLMRPLLASLVFVAVATQLRADDPELAHLQGLDADLRVLIGKHYPDATFKFAAGEYQLAANTMTFTLHRRFRDGRISTDTYQTVGPQYRGFIIVIDDLGNKSYGGPLVIPQTLRDPYWYTYVNEIKDRISGRNLWVRYHYGRRVDSDFHQGVLSLLCGKSSVSVRKSGHHQERSGEP